MGGVLCEKQGESRTKETEQNVWRLKSQRDEQLDQKRSLPPQTTRLPLTITAQNKVTSDLLSNTAF